MRQYDLSSEEGVLLMYVAEARLRIPDGDTADRLIRDKLGDAVWDSHLGQSDSLFANASTWGLIMIGHLATLADETRGNVSGALRRPVGRAGAPGLGIAVRTRIRFRGHPFVK